MPGKYSVKLSTIVKEHGLEPLHTSKDYETRLLTEADVNRPALQLAGFYNYFDPNRLQILGRVESTYLELKSDDERRQCFEELMKYDLSAVVVCHGARAFPECIEMAEKYDRNLFHPRGHLRLHGGRDKLAAHPPCAENDDARRACRGARRGRAHNGRLRHWQERDGA